MPASEVPPAKLGGILSSQVARITDAIFRPRARRALGVDILAMIREFAHGAMHVETGQPATREFAPQFIREGEGAHPCLLA
jgi:hypothetical protein